MTSGLLPAVDIRSHPVLAGREVSYPVGSDESQPAVPYERYSEHRGRWPDPDLVRLQDPSALLARLEHADLTGHGGASFPVHRKWRSMLDQPPGGVVVCNAAESEPLSAKDLALVQLRPHLVLDGLLVTVRALRADRAVIWLHQPAQRTRGILSAAMAERDDELASMVTLQADAEGYLAGESSAIVHALSGGPALPRFSRQPSTVAGVDGLPTLVHNVETLARIALLARGCEPSGALFTLADEGIRTVLELAATSRLIEAFPAFGSRGAPRALLVGGYGGRWLAGTELAAARAGAGRAAGRHPLWGAGVLLPLYAGECGLQRTSAILEYLAAAGAGQCGPCRLGLPAISDHFAKLIDGGRRPPDLTQLRRLLPQVDGRGACRHPDGAVQLAASALQVFAADVEHHLRTRSCADAG